MKLVVLDGWSELKDEGQLAAQQNNTFVQQILAWEFAFMKRVSMLPWWEIKHGGILHKAESLWVVTKMLLYNIQSINCY